MYTYIYIYVCVCVCVYIYTYTDKHTYIYTYLYTYISIYIHIYGYRYRYRYIYISLSLYIYIYLYTSISISIYIYISVNLASKLFGPASTCLSADPGPGLSFGGEHRPFEWGWRAVGMCSPCLGWWGRLCRRRCAAGGCARAVLVWGGFSRG